LTPNEKVKLLTRSLEDNESQKVESKVKEMINEISTDGEKALFKYEKMFGNNSKTFLVSELEMTEGNKISAIQKRSIKYAYNNIKQFYGKQVPKKVVIKNKFKTLEKVYVPITNVGLYIPGGTCPLVSTILMTGTLAQIAKCKNVVMCTPTDKDGNINQAILYAAKLVGINKIFKIGGVQAICAMGYGIGGVPKVNKIFGPGNQ
jgi:histidinol dehydrogenase